VTIYSETSIYRSWIIRFPGSVVQFLWCLSESYLNYGSRMYCFPGSIVSFSDPQWKRWIEVHCICIILILRYLVSNIWDHFLGLSCLFAEILLLFWQMLEFSSSRWKVYTGQTACNISEGFSICQEPRTEAPVSSNSQTMHPNQR
jgi:hypothetical protein